MSRPRSDRFFRNMLAVVLFWYGCAVLSWWLQVPWVTVYVLSLGVVMSGQCTWWTWSDMRR